MMTNKLTLSVLKETFAICKLANNSPIPPWAADGEFFSITRTHDELSIVCFEKYVPADVTVEKDWAAIKVDGPLDFSMTGILLSITTVLAKSKISVFAISTYDTDYVLVKKDKVDAALKALSNNFAIAR
ncbi:MAG: ACT domain-containing protein [bacterium]